MTHGTGFEFPLLAHILQMLLASKINSHISLNFCPIKALNANQYKILCEVWFPCRPELIPKQLVFNIEKSLLTTWKTADICILTQQHKRNLLVAHFSNVVLRGMERKLKATIGKSIENRVLKLITKVAYQFFAKIGTTYRENKNCLLNFKLKGYSFLKKSRIESVFNIKTYFIVTCADGIFKFYTFFIFNHSYNNKLKCT